MFSFVCPSLLWGLRESLNVKIINQADQNSGSVTMDTHHWSKPRHQKMLSNTLSVSFSVTGRLASGERKALQGDSVHMFVLWIIKSIFMHKYTNTDTLCRQVQYMQVVWVYIQYAFVWLCLSTCLFCAFNMGICAVLALLVWSGETGKEGN